MLFFISSSETLFILLFGISLNCFLSKLDNISFFMFAAAYLSILYPFSFNASAKALSEIFLLFFKISIASFFIYSNLLLLEFPILFFFLYSVITSLSKFNSFAISSSVKGFFLSSNFNISFIIFPISIITIPHFNLRII
ncbi:hypothetical protein SDC9_57008 [bioreactor metagenome]|uniref:Uncharacterized protein n=1 Tax=bioreactor metagenome TaxID=1076179 RepID=A0A644X959_9ZZZZ